MSGAPSKQVRLRGFHKPRRKDSGSNTQLPKLKFLIDAGGSSENSHRAFCHMHSHVAFFLRQLSSIKAQRLRYRAALRGFLSRFLVFKLAVKRKINFYGFRKERQRSGEHQRAVEFVISP